MKIKFDKRGAAALTQVFVLVLAIFAVAYAIGNLSLVDGAGVKYNYFSGPKKFIQTEGGDFTKNTDGSFTKIGSDEKFFEGRDGLASFPDSKTSSADKVSTTQNPVQTGGSSFVSNFIGIKDATVDGKAVSGGFFSWQTGGAVDAVVSGAQWGLAVGFAVKFLGSFLGDEDNQAKWDAAASALGWGVAAGKTTYTLIGEQGALSGGAVESWLTGGGTISAGASAFVIGAVVAIAIYLATYKDEEIEIITFECLPWEAPTGGSDCEKCNQQGVLPCSEYQCRSLGQSCQIVNPGTDEEACVWVNRQDVEFPIIEPWEEALSVDHRYAPDNAISPPDRGVKIISQESTNGCVQAFTPLSFGIRLDEPASCKLDAVRKEKFEDMQFYFGGSNYLRYNHTQILSLPGPSAFESGNLTIQNDGDYSLFARCRDANGNENTANFLFNFCVEKGPDTTPPLIVTTSLINGAPIAFDQSSVDIITYVNEPSSCRWSTRDQSYDDMENNMACVSSPLEMNAQLLYACETTLNGLKNRETNNFFFRCEDQPLKPISERNKNAQSYDFSLIGTQPLVLNEVKPKPGETIKDATNVVKVTLEAETSAGHKEGEATCYYSDTGEEDSYIAFFDTGVASGRTTAPNKHSQELNLVEGDYEFFIRCLDLGGNADTKSTMFTVESDTSAPAAVRVYHEENNLKIVTDEKAKCVYSRDSCNYLFDDGIRMQVIDEVNHFAEWNVNTNYYVKCEDEFGNQPLPNACNIIVRPTDIFVE